MQGALVQLDGLAPRQPRCEHRAFAHPRPAGHHHPAIHALLDQEPVELARSPVRPMNPACRCSSIAKSIAPAGNGNALVVAAGFLRDPRPALRGSDTPVSHPDTPL
jgi:hypothetical protein